MLIQTTTKILNLPYYEKKHEDSRKNMAKHENMQNLQKA